MPSEKQPFYDPVPPTYDEALASGSRREDAWAGPSRSSVDHRNADETETQTLLASSSATGSSSRRPHGYQPPTVETDDEDSLWELDSDTDEADHVRLEMEEMDMEEPDRSSGFLWRKRLPFRLSLPQWKWSWRPRLPRLRIQLPSRPEGSGSAETGNEGGEGEESSAQSRLRIAWPQINSTLVILTIARLLALFVILGFLFFVFSSGLLTGLNSPLAGGRRFNAEDLRNHIQTSVEPQRLRASVNHYSSYAHIAGTEGDYATAMDMESMFNRAGLEDVELDEYYVYLNYPRKDGRTVQIMEDRAGMKAKWTAKLEEEERHTETAGRQTYSFHGLSKAGDVKGPLIYANYGSRDDFQKLKDLGIQTKGAIALVRYYGTQMDLSLKVKAAEMAGFAGCITYSDPADDGFLRGKEAPKGRYMPKDGVQRGSVGLMSRVVGDVLTPGWESKADVPRMKLEEAPGLVQIPSLPLSWGDAQVLLQHLKGHGEKVADKWKGGVPDVEWWTGNASSPIVRLRNEQDEVDKKPIWNVYGRIQGFEQSAKSIILGNHRDSWAFGATDPHSGTAVMIELARIFGEMTELGWRPLRTIEFMSWDAEQYNLIGSTEFVERNLDELRANAYAYINLDGVVSGSHFRAAGSPVFRKTLLHALNRVLDPNANATLKELWDKDKKELEGLGGGGDYVAFQDIAGTSSLDLQFSGNSFDPYPYHSSYDNFELVETVMDPDYSYHAMMAQVVGLLLLDLSDRAILPFDIVGYADKLKHWVDDLEKWIGQKVKGKDAAGLSVKELKDAASMIQANAQEFQKWELQWDSNIAASGGWEANDVGALRVMYNDRFAQFETALLDIERTGGVSGFSDPISLLPKLTRIYRFLTVLNSNTSSSDLIFGLVMMNRTSPPFEIQWKHANTVLPRG